jgi:hypothetical protein
MAKLGISTGIVPDDGLGDSLLDGAVKINSNFSEIYTYFGDGNDLTFTTFSGDYGDLNNTPVNLSDFSNDVGFTTFSGDYGDLNNTPVNLSDFSNDVGFITSFTNTDTNYWEQTSAGIHTLSNVGIGTTNPTENLTVFGDARVTGILTVGTASITLNGSSNTITVGSGVTINGSTGVIQATSLVVGGTTLTGTAVTSITAGSGISVDQSTGNVTITATGGGVTTGIATDSERLGAELPSYYLDYDNFTNTPTNLSDFSNDVGFITSFTDTNYWGQTLSGIHTLSNVGIGTTNPTSALTVKGNTSLETLNVSGVSTFTRPITVTGSQYSIFGNGLIVQGTAVSDLNANNFAVQLQNGLQITNNSVEEKAYISAQSGDMFLTGKLSTLNGLHVIAGVSTFAGITTVTGPTLFTKQLNVSGVSTLSSNVSVGGTISIDGGVKLATNNPTIVGTSATAGEIKRIGGAPFFYDGSAWREFVLSSGTPVTIPADTEWDSVIFRATFDDDYTDAKFGATPVFVSAGSSIVGAAVTIGTGAYRNDGSIGAGISYAYRSEYDFTGSWTIEFWIYHDRAPNQGAHESLVSQYSPNNSTAEWTFSINADSFGNVIWHWNNEENNAALRGLYVVSNSTFSSKFVNKWNHYALVREGNDGSLHFYINGIESSSTTNRSIIDNNIVSLNGAGLYIGGDGTSGSPSINGISHNNGSSIDAIFDDMRISAGVGTAGQRYTSVGISTIATFTPPTTELPVTGTLSSYVQPPGDKYGEIGLGTSPTWRGTSGVTVNQQSSGNYRVSFASTYTNSNDYFVLSQAMDQGFASYVGVARSTTHVDFAINKESDDTAVDTGSLSVQIKNHN